MGMYNQTYAYVHLRAYILVYVSVRVCCKSFVLIYLVISTSHKLLGSLHWQLRFAYNVILLVEHWLTWYVSLTSSFCWSLCFMDFKEWGQHSQC